MSLRVGFTLNEAGRLEPNSFFTQFIGVKAKKIP